MAHDALFPFVALVETSMERALGEYCEEPSVRSPVYVCTLPGVINGPPLSAAFFSIAKTTTQRSAAEKEY